MAFRVGIGRDLLNAAGIPTFGTEALKALDANKDLEWSWIDMMPEVTPDLAAAFDGLYVNLARVPATAVMRADKRLKVVARNGVGYDSVDVKAMTAAGVVVTNTPIAVRRPMAVATMTLVLALTGRLLEKNRITRRPGWAGRNEAMGMGLTGRTLALIGAGGIGQEIMTLARPFFGRMIAADPYGDVARVNQLGGVLVPFDTAMSEGDVIVVCCLLNDQTRGLVDARALGLMKPTSYLVNVARGPVVDEAALIETLTAGRIAGAGLDVFEKEPPDPANPLLAMENLVLTPHALGWTDECFHDIASTGLTSIVDVSMGRRPAHVVNPEVYGKV
jgi:D-3-phosphoglycerate dehydrogenase